MKYYFNLVGLKFRSQGRIKGQTVLVFRGEAGFPASPLLFIKREMTKLSVKESLRKREANLNSACIEGGKRLLKEAEADHLKRKLDGHKRTEPVAKDLAHYIAGVNRGRVSILAGGSYCCFKCLYHRTDIQVNGKPICVVCNNGMYFTEKEDCHEGSNSSKKHN